MKVTAHEKQLSAVRSEIAESCHNWAVKDAHREIVENCPLLRKVRSQAAYLILEMLEPLTEDDRLRLINALVRRFHMGGPDSAGKILTPEDKRLVAQYLEYDHDEILPGVRARVPILRDGSGKRLAQAETRFPLPRIDRSALHKLIIEKLREVCGGKPVNLGPGSSFFETRVGPWIVSTQFSTTSRFRHFDYRHRIVVPGGIIVGEGISILRWLGVSGMTDWTLQDESEVECAVQDLSNICAHFLNAAPAILRGLKPPTPMVH